MDKDGFELFKYSARSNMLDWIKNLLIVEYAEVVEVFDVNTVKVRLLVQEGQVNNVFTVRLIWPGSSKLVEETVQPQEHDSVLLLFLRSHDDLMFLDSEARSKIDPDGVSTLQNVNDSMNRYSMFSGVGILAKTSNTRAPSSVHYGQDDSGPYVDSQTAARVMQAFKSAVSLVFDSPRIDAETPGPDAPITLLFGRQSPVSIEFRNALHIKTSGPESAIVMDLEGDLDVDTQGDVDIEGAEGSVFYIKKIGAKDVAREGDDVRVDDGTDSANIEALQAVCSIFGIPFNSDTQGLKGKITSGSGRLKIGD